MASPFGIKTIKIINLLFYQLMWKYYRYFILAVSYFNLAQRRVAAVWTFHIE